jgi:hypothetical protein
MMKYGKQPECLRQIKQILWKLNHILVNKVEDNLKKSTYKSEHNQSMKNYLNLCE